LPANSSEQIQDEREERVNAAMLEMTTALHAEEET
jgi:hypothetical protein